MQITLTEQVGFGNQVEQEDNMSADKKNRYVLISRVSTIGKSLEDEVDQANPIEAFSNAQNIRDATTSRFVSHHLCKIEKNTVNSLSSG